MINTTQAHQTPDDEPNPDLFQGDGPDPSVNIEIAMLCDHLIERGVRVFQIDYSDSGGTRGWEIEPKSVVIDKRIADRIVELAEQWTRDCAFDDYRSFGTFKIWPGPKLVEQKHYVCFEDDEAQALPDLHLSENLRSDLKVHAVSRVEVHWEGSGDEGSLEDWQCFTTDGEEVQVPEDIIDRLDNLITDGLPAGCWNNEGSYGNIDVQVGSGVVSYDFHNRIELESDGEYTRWRLLSETQEGKEEDSGEPVPPLPE